MTETMFAVLLLVAATVFALCAAFVPFLPAQTVFGAWACVCLVMGIWYLWGSWKERKNVR